MPKEVKMVEVVALMGDRKVGWLTAYTCSPVWPSPEPVHSTEAPKDYDRYVHMSAEVSFMLWAGLTAIPSPITYHFPILSIPSPFSSYLTIFLQ